MAKKSLIEREKKRQRLEQKYRAIRESLKKKEVFFSSQEKIICKIQSLPRNSAPTRLHRRCFLTGRPRGFYRDFGFCGHVFRKMAHACLLPGIIKSSW
uniref:Small ribosomal subunit protein uS14c n=7 Tax=Ephedra TaxID=3387 RepID=A0A8F4YKP2_9SPER|nr:ribosomal protein S14 [Ephedra foeminea]YP_010451830.1 ribosomal protein S14 [Ephedra alata]YP_010451897.1 ribosomal protein S14 [Ephedra altissima]YP_010452165.1 ribosomal protein S14 [Ephedra aphylla]YP_010452366.1 ribosomal protein S14 [Ephedra ciliata]YP_010452633.1 ribosomal protein S14 [Ephedra foliata]YP_010452700.1 ribosomal protein S14 [Ephedra fragilis]ALV90127.1 ribosomal protein S14 [Ephedra foeminea]QXG15732.1 ribosomal protein S14 [Ephedra alata]QXG15799.1 ribosomal protei